MANNANKILVFAILSFVLWSIPVYGSDWIQYGSYSTAKGYYDRERLIRTDEIVNVWNKFVYTIPQKNNDMEFTEAALFIEFNCSKRTSRYLKFFIEYSDGSRAADDMNGESADIRPDNFLYDLFKAVCK